MHPKAYIDVKFKRGQPNPTSMALRCDESGVAVGQGLFIESQGILASNGSGIVARKSTAFHASEEDQDVFGKGEASEEADLLVNLGHVESVTLYSFLKRIGCGELGEGKEGKNLQMEVPMVRTG